MDHKLKQNSPLEKSVQLSPKSYGETDGRIFMASKDSGPILNECCDGLRRFMDDTIIIYNFHKRRAIFDDYLKKSGFNRCTCPSCGYPTISSRGNYDWCIICNWEDDGQDDETADEIWGSPNGDLSLTASRVKIRTELDDLERTLGGPLNLIPDKVCKIIEIGYERYLLTKNKNPLELWEVYCDEKKDWRARLLHELITEQTGSKKSLRGHS